MERTWDRIIASVGIGAIGFVLILSVIAAADAERALRAANAANVRTHEAIDRMEALLTATPRP